MEYQGFRWKIVAIGFTVLGCIVAAYALTDHRSPHTDTTGGVVPWADDLRSVNGLFGADLSVSPTSESTHRKAGIYEDLRKIRLGNDVEIAIGAESNKLLSVVVYKLEEVPANLPQSDAISRDTALASAKMLLERLKVPLSLDSNDVKLEDIIHPEQGEDLAGAVWMATKFYAYDGVPSLDHCVRIRISAFSGKIETYTHYAPVSGAVQGKLELSSNDATARFDEIIRARGFTQKIEEPQLRVTTEVSMFGKSPPWPIYVYVCPVLDREKHRRAIYIRATTGDEFVPVILR